MQSVNADYLRALDPAELVARAGSWLEDRWSPLAALVQERARTLGEVFDMSAFLFLPAPVVDEAEWAKGVRKVPAFGAILDAAIERFAVVDWDAAALRSATADAGAACDVPQLAKAQAPIRLAVTGRSVGPPLFESLELLGRDRTLERLRVGRDRLAAAGP
jgi:glutamyl-tRNA synthetase